MSETNFSKDVRLVVKTTNYKKKRIKARARALGLTLSQYVRKLISDDMRQDKNE